MHTLIGLRTKPNYTNFDSIDFMDTRPVWENLLLFFDIDEIFCERNKHPVNVAHISHISHIILANKRNVQCFSGWILVRDVLKLMQAPPHRPTIIYESFLADAKMECKREKIECFQLVFGYRSLFIHIDIRVYSIRCVCVCVFATNRFVEPFKIRIESNFQLTISCVGYLSRSSNKTDFYVHL